MADDDHENVPFLDYSNMSGEQRFMMMMNDRIEHLEKQIDKLELQLQKQMSIEEVVTSRYFKLYIERRIDLSVKTYREHVYQILDDVFSARAVMKPVFAAWHWDSTLDDGGEVMTMDLYVSTESILRQIDMSAHVNSYEKGVQNKENKENKDTCVWALDIFQDSYQFIESLKFNIHPYEQSDDDSWGYEFWNHLGNGKMGFVMNTDPFTKSSNYLDCSELQLYYSGLFAHENWDALMDFCDGL